MKKRILTLVLALVMCLALAPATVLAADNSVVIVIPDLKGYKTFYAEGWGDEQAPVVDA